MGSLQLEGRNCWVELDDKKYKCCKSYKIKWYKSRRSQLRSGSALKGGLQGELSFVW